MKQCDIYFPGFLNHTTHNFDVTNQWEPSKLEEVGDEKIDLVFQPFTSDEELQIPAEGEACRFGIKLALLFV